jgi:hypothetical protein
MSRRGLKSRVYNPKPQDGALCLRAQDLRVSLTPSTQSTALPQTLNPIQNPDDERLACGALRSLRQQPPGRALKPMQARQNSEPKTLTTRALKTQARQKERRKRPRGEDEPAGRPLEAPQPDGVSTAPPGGEPAEGEGVDAAAAAHEHAQQGDGQVGCHQKWGAAPIRNGVRLLPEMGCDFHVMVMARWATPSIECNWAPAAWELPWEGARLWLCLPLCCGLALWGSSMG